jgi:hypothetical protein
MKGTKGKTERRREEQKRRKEGEE